MRHYPSSPQYCTVDSEGEMDYNIPPPDLEFSGPKSYREMNIRRATNMPAYPETSKMQRTLPVERYATSSNSSRETTLEDTSKMPHYWTKQNKNDIERAEDGVRSAREDLLGSRFRLKDQRKDLRNLRQKTGQEEGVVVSQLRSIFNARSIDFPVALENTFTRVIELRDQLGSLEGKYEEEEDKYDETEWDYAQKEEAFVEQLLDDGGSALEEGKHAMSDNVPPYILPPSETVRPTEVPLLRSEILTSNSSKTLKPMRITEPMLEQFEQLSSPSPSSDSWIPQPSLGYGEDAIMFPPLPRARSEPNISQVQVDWNKMRTRVDKWILDTVSCSHRQKLILRNLISQDDLDDAAWWDMVTQNWIMEIPSTPPLGMNAEDSLGASHDADIPPIVSVPVSVMSDKSDTEHPCARPVFEEQDVCYVPNDHWGLSSISPVVEDCNSLHKPTSGHPEPRDLNIELGTSSNASLPTVNKQQERDSITQTVPPFETDRSQQSSIIPVASSNVKLSDQSWDGGAVNDCKELEESNVNEEGVMSRRKLYPARHRANTEPTSLTPSVQRPKYHGYRHSTHLDLQTRRRLLCIRPSSYPFAVSDQDQ